MRLTVLGARGAFPEADDACSGFLLEHDGFRLLLDAGYATFPRLLAVCTAADVDAVFVTHGHPDHCVDLNPLLRARSLADDPRPPLPVYAPPGALDAVLALDRPGMLDYALTPVGDGDRVGIGPFTVDVRTLPHFVPNNGVRVAAGGVVLAYQGDSGPTPDLAALAGEADLLLAEATYPEAVPGHSAGRLSSALDAGAAANSAGVGRLLLTHLWPGLTDAAALGAARSAYAGPVDMAQAGQGWNLSG
ncbi:MBL fold metallo-hydrolase [Asanoa ishikariensis]|uniref:Ribonuclease BN, tRNA processing enzyme n=1 Tax=Asanoa ishikariensis TaxID=137265 RepID=A0A1H3R4A3_9ACTN|nr:MBL fold metallo-hydrolase [Asanoa ishikariensis]GIF64419.1 MBL fold metallo-hydrolase [Asanoa ishikariensis]SDZ20624.1 Ribonuclease BN, tRNA processing enzyme [Asanoa ishikariensis]